MLADNNIMIMIDNYTCMWSLTHVQRAVRDILAGVEWPDVSPWVLLELPNSIIAN